MRVPGLQLDEILHRRIRDDLAAREREAREVDLIGPLRLLPLAGLRLHHEVERGHQLAPVVVARGAAVGIVIDHAEDETDDELVRLHAALVEAVVVRIGRAAVRLVGAELHRRRDVETIDLALRHLRTRVGEPRAVGVDLRLPALTRRAEVDDLHVPLLERRLIDLFELTAVDRHVRGAERAECRLGLRADRLEDLLGRCVRLDDRGTRKSCH